MFRDRAPHRGSRLREGAAIALAACLLTAVTGMAAAQQGLSPLNRQAYGECTFGCEMAYRKCRPDETGRMRQCAATRRACLADCLRRFETDKPKKPARS